MNKNQKYHLYTFFTQFSSCIVFLLYKNKNLGISKALNINLLLMFFKFLKEVKYNKFDTSLALHHSAQILVNLICQLKKYKPYQFLILHFPEV